MEKCLESRLYFIAQPVFFAPLIITDVSVKHDTHVPSMVWLQALNQSASIGVYRGAITCPKLPPSRQLLLLLFLICPHLVDIARQSDFPVLHLSPKMTPGFAETPPCQCVYLTKVSRAKYSL